MEWFKRAWRGEELCWKVFWIYGVLGGIAWVYGAGALQETFKFNPPVKFVFGLCNAAYLLWSVVATWRCAFKLGFRFLGYFVRILVLGFPIAFFGIASADGMKKGEVMMQAWQCKRIAIDSQYSDAHPDILSRCRNEAEKKRR